MRAHVIEGGKIVNTIEVMSLDFLPGLVDADKVGGSIGDLCDGVSVTKSLPPISKKEEVAKAREAALEKLLMENPDYAAALAQ